MTAIEKIRLRGIINKLNEVSIVCKFKVSDLGWIIDLYDAQDNLVVYIDNESATFASNISRLESVLQAAHSTGRKVAFLGRSLFRNSDIAMKLNKKMSERAHGSFSIKSD
jgi:hypothetical protein